ncbi:MAG: DUF2852 domain-containing protein [Rhodobacteraceae bacterium]|nr:DUF2852 domain-containing protein [Paracoccaceae bacterium]MBD0866603.1 DUF2852 domain-containing protein [Paracoccaceae bacterium]
MTPTAYPDRAYAVKGWFSRTEAWLDSKGRWAWIALMVLAFIVFWPLGLAVLAFMIWGGKFSSRRCRQGARPHVRIMESSGNAAFDAYRDQTIRRLEEEQTSFAEFLQRLRDAKDKAEFDAFMAERERKAAEAQDGASAGAPARD